MISENQLIAGSWKASFYGYDGHGSVRFLTDEKGTKTDSYDYDAFGILINKTGTTPNVYLYAGEQWDGDLGLYYNRARYLNTNTGRFFTQDSFEGNSEDPLSLHKYLYAGNDPINKIDPSGHFIGAALDILGAVNIQSTLLSVQSNLGFAVKAQIENGGYAGFQEIALQVLIPFGLVSAFKSVNKILGFVAKGLGKSSRLIGRFSNLKLPGGFQRHHLNQEAAFGTIISRSDGICVGLQGGTNIVDSEHYLFHQEMNKFWKPFQKGGIKYQQKPMCFEYDEALKQSLQAKGLHPREVDALADLAREQRLSYGLTDQDPVPDIPRK